MAGGDSEPGSGGYGAGRHRKSIGRAELQQSVRTHRRRDPDRLQLRIQAADRLIGGDARDGARQRNRLLAVAVATVKACVAPGKEGPARIQSSRVKAGGAAVNPVPAPSTLVLAIPSPAESTATPLRFTDTWAFAALLPPPT